MGIFYSVVDMTALIFICMQMLKPVGNFLPRHIHAVLPERVTRNRRIIILGDVHGCIDEFNHILQLCSYEADSDILLSVGDLVNKGPSSLSVLDRVQRFGVVAVRGNHEEIALAAWREVRRGMPPPKMRYAWVKDLDDGLVSTLNALPFTLRLPSYNVTVVHAGLIPGIKVEDQNPSNLLLMRDILPVGGGNDVPEEESGDESNEESEAEVVVPNRADAELMEMSTMFRGSRRHHPKGRPWASVWKGFPDGGHVFFGHDAARGLQAEPWATGLDGGCVYGGRLYAALLPPLNAQGETCTCPNVPPNATKLVLGTGLPAWLVSIPAGKVYSSPKRRAPRAVAESDTLNS